MTPEQKRWLEGLTSGLEVARTSRGLPPLFGLQAKAAQPAAAGAPTGPDAAMLQAQAAQIAAGRKLTEIEQFKREKHPLDRYDELLANAVGDSAPKGLQNFAFRYQGIFWVAPAQDGYMSRMRIPGGMLKSFQARGIADLAARHGGGYIDVTTRANLQIREIRPADAPAYLNALTDLGIVPKGSGADNIRNVTGSPTAGIDPNELRDCRPECFAWHHYVLNNRDMYGLPRKFNVAFDGGGMIAALEDTNDIGFSAVEVGDGAGIAPGVYYKLTLGGITGHKDFARPTGVVCRPDDAVAVAAALVRAYSAHGDRTDRKKARLKYLLDAWGFDKFLTEAEKFYGKPFTRVPETAIAPRPAQDRRAHIGIHPQKQPGLYWVGVEIPAARLTPAQLTGLADLADRFGSGLLRLTVWQNLLISDIAEADLDAVRAAIGDLGLRVDSNAIRAGLIACTGRASCKFGLADTKANALRLAAHLETKFDLDGPLNIHLTGCHHSCAQHYIGDIGLIGARVERGDDEIDGFDVYLGGGAGADQGIARPLWQKIAAEDLPAHLEALLARYLAERADGQNFLAFTRSLDDAALADFGRRALAGLAHAAE